MKRCDHVSYPDGRCSEHAVLQIETPDYPTWKTCETHAGIRLGVMARAGGPVTVRWIG